MRPLSTSTTVNNNDFESLVTKVPNNHKQHYVILSAQVLALSVLLQLQAQ
jgi:hypothetical protein